MTRPAVRPVPRTQPTADLAAFDPVSRGLPLDWVILRHNRPIGVVACSDAETALQLATYRNGVGVTVRRQGVRS